MPPTPPSRLQEGADLLQGAFLSQFLEKKAYMSQSSSPGEREGRGHHDARCGRGLPAATGVAADTVRKEQRHF